MSTILIVEDEERIASFIVRGLKVAGFTPTVTASGRKTIQFGLMGDFDLIILDLGLSDIDDFDVLEELHGQGVATPIIMLAVCLLVVDCITDLENGANNYTAEPFSYKELLARIRLCLRDSASASQSSTAMTALSYGNLTLDYQTRQITVDECAIDSSTRKFMLAEMFLRNPRQVLNRKQLLSAVWGMDFDSESSIVGMYMSYLRPKLGKEHFETARGMGYRLLQSPSRLSLISSMSSSQSSLSRLTGGTGTIGVGAGVEVVGEGGGVEVSTGATFPLVGDEGNCSPSPLGCCVMGASSCDALDYANWAPPDSDMTVPEETASPETTVSADASHQATTMVTRARATRAAASRCSDSPMCSALSFVAPSQ